MDPIYLAASGVAVLLASAAFFFLGARKGRSGEIERQAVAKATAEETARRIVSEAEREAESTRKAAIITGKEEQIKLRESWEAEARHRREEIEREERRLDEQESQLEKKLELVEGRDRELGK